MKKAIAILICLFLFITITGCSANQLPQGKNAEIHIDRAGTQWHFTAKSYEYLNETTVKAVREYNGKLETFYIPATSIVYIIEEDTME